MWLPIGTCTHCMGHSHCYALCWNVFLSLVFSSSLYLPTVSSLSWFDFIFLCTHTHLFAASTSSPFSPLVYPQCYLIHSLTFIYSPLFPSHWFHSLSPHSYTIGLSWGQWGRHSLSPVWSVGAIWKPLSFHLFSSSPLSLYMERPYSLPLSHIPHSLLLLSHSRGKIDSDMGLLFLQETFNFLRDRIYTFTQ